MFSLGFPEGPPLSPPPPLRETHAPCLIQGCCRGALASEARSRAALVQTIPIRLACLRAGASRWGFANGPCPAGLTRLVWAILRPQRRGRNVHRTAVSVKGGANCGWSDEPAWSFSGAWCHVVCGPGLAVRSQQLAWAVGMS